MRHAILLLAVASSTACGRDVPVYRPDPDPGPPPLARAVVPSRAVASPARPVAPPVRPAGGLGTEARAFFAERCASCHGAGGRGDGPSARLVTPPPGNLTDPAWQASVTDDHLSRVIVHGGPAVGRSPAMPGAADLEGKDALIRGLVHLIRSFKR